VEGAIASCEGTHTKGQYTTAWPVDNLIISGSVDNNNPLYIESLAHPATPSGCAFFAVVRVQLCHLKGLEITGFEYSYQHPYEIVTRGDGAA